MDRERALQLAHDFFVRGTIHRSTFGAAPLIQFNDRRTTDIEVPNGLEPDVRLLERVLGVGFFHYGPRLWMLGEIEPLKDLQDRDRSIPVIEKILTNYPARTVSSGETLYRIRVGPTCPAAASEYDAPPLTHCGSGRLDCEGFPVLYGSQDLQVCIHECRVTSEDEVFVATLTPTRDMRLLDLSVVFEERVTEFESLDIAVHMLFLAGHHSYPITRNIARAAREAGYEGIVYPSYFSLLRTGGMPYDTIYGISLRRIPELMDIARSQVIPNVAVFGRPVEQGLMSVRCINRLVLNKVEYDVILGPIGI